MSLYLCLLGSDALYRFEGPARIDPAHHFLCHVDAVSKSPSRVLVRVAFERGKFPARKDCGR
jgi:hypothetical protein